MEVLPIVVGAIVLIILFREDETAMDEQQIAESKKIKGETQIEKSKAKKSLYSSISNLANMLKV